MESCHGKESHSNAVWIDTHPCAKSIFFFEPHGSDFSEAEHGPLQSYYDSAAYFTILKAAIQKIDSYRGYRVFTPDDYLPNVFGPSWTQDKWCLSWSFWFLLFSTLENPKNPTEVLELKDTGPFNFKHLITQRYSDNQLVDAVKVFTVCLYDLMHSKSSSFVSNFNTFNERFRKILQECRSGTKADT